MAWEYPHVSVSAMEHNGWWAAICREMKEYEGEIVSVGYSRAAGRKAIRWLVGLFRMEAKRNPHAPIQTLVDRVAEVHMREALRASRADRWSSPALILVFGLRHTRELILAETPPAPEDVALIRLRLRELILRRELRDVRQAQVLNRQLPRRERKAC